jgi:hypothetical protein
VTLSKARACELVSYDAESGIFIRLKSRKNWVGKQAGKTDSQGHRQILLDGTVYQAHRVAWLIMTGMWPSMEIDHKDGNPANNSWANLRLATRVQNLRNKGCDSDSKTGIKGVCLVMWKKSTRWRVSVSGDDGRRVSHFKCFGQAVKHAKRLRAELHHDFVNHGIAA